MFTPDALRRGAAQRCDQTFKELYFHGCSYVIAQQGHRPANTFPSFTVLMHGYNYTFMHFAVPVEETNGRRDHVKQEIPILYPSEVQDI